MSRWDRLSAEQAATLPGGPKVISCANTTCNSKASPPSLPMIEGHPMPPDGWGAIELIFDNGGVFVVFVCGRACERAIAAHPPALRGVGEPKPKTLWRPDADR